MCGCRFTRLIITPVQLSLTQRNNIFFSSYSKSRSPPNFFTFELPWCEFISIFLSGIRLAIWNLHFQPDQVPIFIIYNTVAEFKFLLLFYFLKIMNTPKLARIDTNIYAASKSPECTLPHGLEIVAFLTIYVLVSFYQCFFASLYLAFYVKSS